MKALLFETYQRLLQNLRYQKHRFLFEKIALQHRMAGLVGPRGVGKTTLLLQLIKEKLDPKKTFYFTADHLYFNQNTLLEFVHDLHIHEGVDVVVIDEIHKYANWNQELKNIYDSFPTLRLFFSGSSSVDIVKGAYDLSRRAVLYHLPGLSLREYLYFNTEVDFPRLQLEDILKDPAAVNADLSQCRGLSKWFKQYLKQGYYPFLQEDAVSYFEKIMRILDKNIFEDVASFYRLKTENLQYFKKIMSFAATIPPGELNTHNLAQSLGVDHKTIDHYSDILQEIRLINRVSTCESGQALLRKSSKLLLSNTTLLQAMAAHLQRTVDVGLVRETFFVQALQDAGIAVHYSKVGDYQVGAAVFELGGKNKTFKQIKNQRDAYLVKDDSLHANARQIPLYLFGFLY